MSDILTGKAGLPLFDDDQKRELQKTAQSIRENPYYKLPIFGDQEKALLNQAILNAPDGDIEAESYRIANAKQFAAMMDVPVEAAYANLDALNEGWLGKKLDPKSNFEAVADSFRLGTLMVDQGKLAAKWKRDGGNNAELEAQLDQIAEEMNRLQDRHPRHWTIEALKAGANSAPFVGTTLVTGAAYATTGLAMATAAGLTGGLAAGAIAPAVYAGLFSFGSFLDSSATMEGLQYYDLRKQGVKHEIAAPLAQISGIIQGATEVFLGQIAGVAGRGITPAIIKKIQENITKKVAVSGMLGTIGRKLSEIPFQSIEEGAEEAIQELTSYATNLIAGELDSEAKIDKLTANELAERIWESAKGGFLASLVMSPGFQGPGIFMSMKEVSQVKKIVGSEPKSKAIDSIMALDAFQELPAEERFKAAEQYYDDLNRQRLKQGKTVVQEPGEVKPAEPPKPPRPIDQVQTEFEETRKVFEANPNDRESFNKLNELIDEMDRAMEIEITEAAPDPDRKARLELDRDEWRKWRKSKIDPMQTVENPPDRNTLESFKQVLKDNVPGLDNEADLNIVSFAAERFARTIPGMDVDTFLDNALVPGVIGPKLEGRSVAQGAVAGAQFVKINNQLKMALRFSEGANGSSVVHELSHAYVNFLKENGNIPEIGNVLKELETSFGIKDGNWEAEAPGWTADYKGTNRSYWEYYSYTLEDYIQTGNLPDPKLKTTFDKIVQWLKDIYKGLIQRTQISQEVKQYFDRLFGDDLSSMAMPKDLEGQLAYIEQKKQEFSGKMDSLINETTSTITGAGVQEIPIDRITLAKDVPNFKEGANDSGVVEPLNAGKYERLGTAPIVVWERLGGEYEVITGRHRLDLARRTGEKTIPAQVVKEAEGFTQEKALTFDAEANIRDGQGSVKDYANYFRNTEIDSAEASSRGLLARDKGRKGFAIGKYAADNLYTLYRNGQIGEGKAAAIAEAAKDNPQLQDLGIRKAKELSASELYDYLRVVQTVKPEAATEQLDMFGNDDSALIEAEKVAKAASQKQAELKTEYAALNSALKLSSKARKTILEKYGVKAGNEAAIRTRIAALTEEIIAWENWTTDAEKYKELRERAGLKVEGKEIEAQGESFTDTDSLTLFQGFLNSDIKQEIKEKIEKEKTNSTARIEKYIQDKEARGDVDKAGFFKRMLANLNKVKERYERIGNHLLNDKNILKRVRESVHTTTGKTFDFAIVHKSSREPGKYQVSYFDAFGPVSHYGPATITQVLDELVQTYPEWELYDAKQMDFTGEGQYINRQPELLFQGEDSKAIQEDVQQNKWVPDSVLEEYRNTDWGKEEIESRDALRREADTFDNVQEFISYQLTMSADATPEQADYFRKIYETREEAPVEKKVNREDANKRFVESLDKPGLEALLAAMAQEDVETAFSALDHGLFTSAIKKILGGGHLTDAHYKKLMDQIKYDVNGFRETSMRLVQDQEGYSDFMREVISDPTAMELEKRKKELSALKKDIDKKNTTIKSLTQDIERERFYSKNIDKKLAGLEDALKSAREEAPKVAAEGKKGLKDALQSAKGESEQLYRLKNETIKSLEEALKSARKEALMLKRASEKRVKELYELKAKVSKMLKTITAPPSASMHWTEQKRLLDLQSKYAINMPKARKEFRGTLPKILERTTDSEIIAKIKAELEINNLKDMSILELEKLADQVQAIRKNGIDMQKIKLLDEKVRFMRDRENILKALEPAMKDPITGRMSKEGRKAAKASLMKNIDLNTLTPERIAEMFQGGREGVFKELLIDLVNQATDDQLRSENRRQQEFKYALDKHGIKINEIGKTITLDGLTYTRQEIMGFYLQMQNEDSRAALLGGDRISENQVREFISKLTTNEKQFADELANIVGGEENYARLEEAIGENRNEIMGRAEKYFPMLRQNLSGEGGIDQQVAADLLERKGLSRGGVRHGWSNSRVKISEQNQKPIRHDAVNIAIQHITATERYIAMQPLLKRLGRLVNDNQIQDAMIRSHGYESVQWLQKYVSDLSQVNIYNDPSTKVSRFLRQNAAIAYLSYNALTILKQFPSVLYYIGDVGPHHLLQAAGQLIMNPRQFIQDVKAMDPQIANRSIDRMLEEMRLADTNAWEGVVKKIGSVGMKGIAFMDMLAVTIGWKAVYNSEMAKHGDYGIAIKRAQEVTMRTQPSARVQNLPQMYRMNEGLNWFLMFTNQLNKIYNIARWDIPTAFQEGQYLKATGYITALILSGLAMGLISRKKLPEDWEDAGADVMVQMLNALPLVGSSIATGLQGWSSAGVDPFPIAQQLGKTLGTIADGEKDLEKKFKEIGNLITEGMVLTGLPQVATKRMYRTFIDDVNDFQFDPWELIGGRPKE